MSVTSAPAYPSLYNLFWLLFHWKTLLCWYVSPSRIFLNTWIAIFLLLGYKKQIKKMIFTRKKNHMLCWNRAYNPSMDNDFYIKKPMLLNAELTTQSRERKNKILHLSIFMKWKIKKQKKNSMHSSLRAMGWIN